MKTYLPLAAGIIGLFASCSGLGAEPIIAGSVQSSKAELDRGRYMVGVGGCNNCHTPGYVRSAGQVAEDELLTGNSTAFAGDWGLSFPTNLRLSMLRFNDEQWLAYTRQLSARPALPWFHLRGMNDADLLSVLRYVQWLGPKGEPAPQALPPGETWIGPAVRYVSSE